MIKPRNEREALEIIKYALENGIRIHVRPPTLEDVFISIVGEEDVEG